MIYARSQKKKRAAVLYRVYHSFARQARKSRKEAQDSGAHRRKLKL
jgi:hypothetical protein